MPAGKSYSEAITSGTCNKEMLSKRGNSEFKEWDQIHHSYLDSSEIFIPGALSLCSTTILSCNIVAYLIG